MFAVFILKSPIYTLIFFRNTNQIRIIDICHWPNKFMFLVKVNVINNTKNTFQQDKRFFDKNKLGDK